MDENWKECPHCDGSAMLPADNEIPTRQYDTCPHCEDGAIDLPEDEDDE